MKKLNKSFIHVENNSENCPQKRAKSFEQTRLSHLKETAEDYTELIADLIKDKGCARVCDIARYMNITHVTALRTLQRLQREDYVETSHHQPITLTQKGKELAAFSKKRHSILLKFLINLGIPEEDALIDVEGMEHHMSEKTLKAIENHLNKCT